MTNTDEPTRRAGLYMRISRDVSGEALGVGRQEEDCRALADRLGWEVAEVYIDNDVSATSGKPRPAYRKMLADLEAGRIDAIVAWHPDRLYRRAVDLGELVEMVQRNRTPVATANAGDVDLNSPTGLLVAEMLAAIAMYEVRHKSERWTRSWRQQRERGVVTRTGSRMFGFTQDGKVIEEEAGIAREMARRLNQGEGLMSLCRWLDTEGIRATRGSAWTPQSVKRYLTNPRIAGWSTLNGDIVGRGEWEPILDQETFETVTAFLTSRTRDFVPRKALLVGALFCGACGKRMITGSYGGGRRSYRCNNRPAVRGCGGVSGNAEAIEVVVETYAQKRLEDERVRSRVAELQAQPTDALAEIASLDLRLTELEQQLEEPDVPVQTLLRAIDRTKVKREEVMAELASRNTVTVPAQGGPWPEDLQRRRALVDLVVERVRLMPARNGSASGNRFDPERVVIDSR